MRIFFTQPSAPCIIIQAARACLEHCPFKKWQEWTWQGLALKSSNYKPNVYDCQAAPTFSLFLKVIGDNAYFPTLFCFLQMNILSLFHWKNWLLKKTRLFFLKKLALLYCDAKVSSSLIDLFIYVSRDTCNTCIKIVEILNMYLSSILSNTKVDGVLYCRHLLKHI